MLEVEKLTMAVMKVFVDLITSKDLDPLSCGSRQVLHLLQVNIQWLQIIEEYSKLSFNEAERQELRSGYLSQSSKQWNKCDPHALYRLSKITHYTKEEIRVIQGEFSRIFNLQEGNDKKVGLTCEEFKEVIEGLIEHPELGRRMKFLRYCSIDRLYMILDREQTGRLDFREVMYSMSVLSRGTGEEKMALMFCLFTAEGNNYLTKMEFDKFLECLTQMMLQAASQNEQFSEADVEDFKTRMSEIFAKYEAVTQVDLHQKIRNDELFDRYVTITNNSLRRNTHLNVANTFRKAEHLKHLSPRGTKHKESDGYISSGDEGDLDHMKLARTVENSQALLNDSNMQEHEYSCNLSNVDSHTEHHLMLPTPDTFRLKSIPECRSPDNSQVMESQHPLNGSPGQSKAEDKLSEESKDPESRKSISNNLADRVAMFNSRPLLGVPVTDTETKQGRGSMVVASSSPRPSLSPDQTSKSQRPTIVTTIDLENTSNNSNRQGENASELKDPGQESCKPCLIM